MNSTNCSNCEQKPELDQIDPYYAPKKLRKTSPAIQKVDSLTTNEAKVLVLYTGGTIGMMCTEKGVYAPAPGMMETHLRKYPQLHDEAYSKLHYPGPENPLVLPSTGEAYRVLYTVFEYEPLLDSSDMTVDDWIRIALDIEQSYNDFDGFVILHGTDTMAYTASALSFMLENLGKPVVITGSQIPLFEVRSDGRENFLNSLIVAGNFSIPEVTVLFRNKLFRGTRTCKISTCSLDAFSSPNMPPLATIGIKIQVDWKNIFRSPNIEKFRVHASLNRNVSLLRLFPSMTVETVRAFLSHPIQGVVLQTYGAGNAPCHRKDLLEEFRKASDRGIIIVNCTQCMMGKVEASYETGNALLEVGVVQGSDMTPEAALTKLIYVLSKEEWSLETKRVMMQTNLRGELTVATRDVKLEDLDVITAVVKAMRLSSSEEVEALRNTLYPSILCSVAARGEIEKLEIMRQFGADLSVPDYSHRTPLHLAAAAGDSLVVEYLLKHGASVHTRDKDGKTPLMTAIDHDNHDAIVLITKAGAHLQQPAHALGEILCSAAARNDVVKIESLILAGADVNEMDQTKRTGLHVAAQTNHLEVAHLLIKHGALTCIKDAFDCTPLQIAKILGHQQMVEFLSKNHND